MGFANRVEFAADHVVDVDIEVTRFAVKEE